MATQDEKEKYAAMCGASIEFIDEVRGESGATFEDVAYCLARFCRKTGSSNPEKDMRNLNWNALGSSEVSRLCHEWFGRTGHLIYPWIIRR